LAIAAVGAAFLVVAAGGLQAQGVPSSSRSVSEMVAASPGPALGPWLRADGSAVAFPQRVSESDTKPHRTQVSKTPLAERPSPWSLISVRDLAEAVLIIIGCVTLVGWAVKAIACFKQSKTTHEDEQIVEPVNMTLLPPENESLNDCSGNESSLPSLSAYSALQKPAKSLQTLIGEASATGELQSAPNSAVARALRQINKSADGRPICGDSMVLNENTVLLTGFYKVTWVNNGELMPGLSRFAILMTKRGRAWHVDNMPSLNRMNFPVPQAVIGK
jgi:hypothetical protein